MAKDTLTITDNRTGKSYEVPIEDETIKATDLRQIKVSSDDFGMMTYDPAFMNTAACRSAITYIDGDKGILRYRGYPIEQLAEQSSFLEVAYLLCEGELPTKAQLQTWDETIKFHTYVHTNITKFLEGFRYDAHPMGMLLGVVGALSTFYPDAKNIHDPANRYLQRVRLLAKAPTIAAFAFRHSRGLPFVFPDNDLDYIGNFVNMTFSIGGRHQPNKVLQRALEILLILHADHEQNCSTSAVRAVGSSHVDPFSAISAGIAALYGPLHGGANEAVLQMLDEIGEKKNIPRFIEEVKAGRGRLMGFGHRVYKSYDPRAKLIKQVADEVFEQTGLNPKLEIALELERIALEDEYFIKRKLYPNVDFYSGLIYQAMGYPTEYFTVLFALGRMPGWLAQWEEMLLDKDQKIARPRQIYHRQGRAAVRPHRQAVRRMTDQLDTLLSEQRRFPPTAEFAAQAAATAALYAAGRDPERFWAEQAQVARVDAARGARCSSGSRRTPSGSSAASSTSSANCLDRHLRGPAAQQGGHHLGRRAGRPPGPHLLGPGPGGAPRAPTRSSGSASGRATGWRSTCRWSPRPPSPCSPAPGSARCTRWSSAASPPSRCATGSTTPRPSRSSPPTAATGAARSCRSSGWPTQALAQAPSIKHCIVVRRRPAARRRVVRRHDRGPRPLVAPAAGAASRPLCPAEAMDARTCSSSSTPPAPPESPRASCTPPAAISPTWPPPRSTSSTCRTTDVFWCTADIGWVTGHSLRRLRPAGQRRHGAHVRGRAGLAGAGPVLAHHRDATGSPSSTPRPPPSAPS